MAEPHDICPVAELPPGERRIVDVDGESIGVFNVDGEFHALKNVCPHQLAPLCEGTVGGTVSPADTVGEYNWEKEGEIIRCPWHKWEFDITTGESVYNPHRMRTRTYETSIESRSETGENHNTSREQSTSEQTTETQAPSATEDGSPNCGVALCGESPPIETYEADVQDEIVVVYV